MAIPDREVGILANFDRADAILNAELNRRIQVTSFSACSSVRSP